MNILTELKNELGYANVTNQYIELAARTFQVDHGNDNLQERAGMVGLSIATLPEDYLKRIANGYIIGVHSCVEHFSYNTVSFQGVRLVVKITAQKMMITG